MCGIAGIWGEADREAVQRMVLAMHHRGPDQDGLFQHGPVHLGMARLSIRDLSEAGRQPMCNARGDITLIFNGELYNCDEHRRDLENRGFAFHSTSDTEVVLHLYEHYGDSFLLKMRGMFALAVYDRRAGKGRERLLLARDHLGIKPLLYAPISGGLVFASEMKALLASGLICREIDPISLRLLLTFGSISQPRTMVQGVHMLPPAHRLIVEGQRLRLERFWALGIDRRCGLRTDRYEQQVAALSEAMADSVRRQMISDVPLGAFLSGGVDSSLLVALMARAVGARIKTFSIGFGPEGKALDESDDARRMAQHLGTDHHAIQLGGADVTQRFEHFVRGLDQPSVDGLNAYFVSLAARQAVTVAISGTGGDELFAGYPWFRTMVQEEQTNRRRPLRSLARTVLASVARQPVFDRWPRRFGPQLERARMTAGFATRYARNHQIFGVQGADRMLAPALRISGQGGRALHYDVRPLDELPHGSTLERVTALCLRGYCTNQLLRDIDAVSMAHSLEVRVPFLDPEVVDLALSLPDAAKLGSVAPDDAGGFPTYRASGAKRVLLDVGRRFLPADFDLQPKRGFNIPMTAWLQGPLRNLVEDTLTAETAQRRGWLDPEQVAGVKKRFFQGQLAWPQPWLLLVLEWWARLVLEA